MDQATSFEKPRGVSRVEARHGFAQVHVQRLPGMLEEARLRVLQTIADAGISIDFLKLTQRGLSFLVAEEKSAEVENALSALGWESTLTRDRSIVLVHAVNMRDEEGLIASILRDTISSGAHVHHVGDMHDRLLLVVDRHESERLAEQFSQALVGSR
jgi:aspartokinase